MFTKELIAWLNTRLKKIFDVNIFSYHSTLTNQLSLIYKPTYIL